MITDKFLRQCLDPTCCSTKDMFQAYAPDSIYALQRTQIASRKIFFDHLASGKVCSHIALNCRMGTSAPSNTHAPSDTVLDVHPTPGRVAYTYFATLQCLITCQKQRQAARLTPDCADCCEGNNESSTQRRGLGCLK